MTDMERIGYSTSEKPGLSVLKAFMYGVDMQSRLVDQRPSPEAVKLYEAVYEALHVLEPYDCPAELTFRPEDASHIHRALKVALKHSAGFGCTGLLYDSSSMGSLEQVGIDVADIESELPALEEFAVLT